MLMPNNSQYKKGSYHTGKNNVDDYSRSIIWIFNPVTPIIINAVLVAVYCASGPLRDV